MVDWISGTTKRFSLTLTTKGLCTEVVEVKGTKLMFTGVLLLEGQAIKSEGLATRDY